MQINRASSRNCRKGKKTVEVIRNMDEKKKRCATEQKVKKYIYTVKLNDLLIIYQLHACKTKCDLLARCVLSLF